MFLGDVRLQRDFEKILKIKSRLKVRNVRIFYLGDASTQIVSPPIDC
jgi:hypothetical protein